MDLQISVVLLFSVFTAGHSFSCYECSGVTGSCAGQTLKTCPSGSSKCESSTLVTGDVSATVKAKNCTTSCLSGSINYGVTKTSFSCCDTDRCNVQDAPAPSNVPNGKTCYSCNGKSCSNILRCSGSEDRCITATVNIHSQSIAVKGCASKSICDAATSLGKNLRLTCCEGNLCNGAESVTQSFLFLCCSLLSFILLH